MTYRLATYHNVQEPQNRKITRGKGGWAQRSTDLELMDTHPFSFEQFRAYLQELERVNRWSLAYRPTLHWLQQATTVVAERRRFSILDIGSGGGDMLRQIEKWAQRRGIEVDLVGVDLNPLGQECRGRSNACRRSPPF